MTPHETEWTKPSDGKGGMVPPMKFQNLAQQIVGATNPLAIPNGTRVKKRNSEPNDRTPDGHLGTIVGASPLDTFAVKGKVILQSYIVEWDGDIHEGTQVHVLVVDHKIERAE